MLSVQKTALLNTDFLAAQAFTFSRELTDQAGSYEIHLFLVIAVEGEEAFSLVRETGGEAESVFFDCQESTAACLELVVQFIQEKLAHLEKLSVTAAAIQEDVLYTASMGEGRGVVWRNRKLLPIKRNTLISGHIKAGDIILFTNQSHLELGHFLETAGDQFLEVVEDQITRSGQTEPVAVIRIDYDLGPVAEPLVSLQQQAGHKSARRFSPVNLFHKLKDFNHSAALRRASFFLSGQHKIQQLTRRRIALLGLLLVLIFAGIWWFKGQDNTKQKEFDYHISQAEQQISQAQGLKDLNQEEAANKLQAADASLKQASELNPKSTKIPELQEQIIRVRKEAMKEYNITQWPVFLNLELVKSGFKASSMQVDGSNLLLLDPKEKTVVLLDLKNKSNQTLAGKEQLGEVQSVDVSGSFAYAISPDKGISRVDIGSKKVTVAVPPDPDIKEIGALKSFGTNLYLIDKLGNAIWKYTPVQSGYSPKIAYLKDGVQVELFDLLKVQIDGAIWVLLKDNEVLKFVSGDKETFAPAQLSNETSELKSLFISDETENIYFLDAGNGQLKIFKKSGEYQYLLSGEKSKTADDLVVDEAGKKAYVLEGNTIYQLDLR